MKPTSCIVLRPFSCLLFLMFVLLSLAGLLISLWINRVTRIENEVNLIVYSINQELSSGIQRTSTLFSSIDASAINLVHILSSSLDENELRSFSHIQSKVMEDCITVESGKYKDLILNHDGELIRQMVAHSHSLNQVSPPKHIGSGLQMTSNYWIAWGSEEEGRDTKERLIGIFALFFGGSSFFISGRAILLSTIAIETARRLFLGMIGSIVRAPLSFFDSIPSTRILKMSSTDQSIVDTDIPYRFLILYSF